MLFTTQPLGVWVLVLFARRDGARGAHISAGAAVNAHVGVNRILFALGDCARGAFVDASAACNAVVANYVSHNGRLFELL